MTPRGSAAKRRQRSAARLACVQALYEMEVSGAGSDPVLQEFMTERWTGVDGVGRRTPPDPAFLRDLVLGASARRSDLDAVIGAALAADRPMERLEIILRAILRAGTFELMSCPGIPARVVINEYVDVAHAFFAGKEAALINAVLDRIARRFRPAEETAGSPDGPAG